MKRATAGSTIMIIGSFTLGQNMIFFIQKFKWIDGLFELLILKQRNSRIFNVIIWRENLSIGIVDLKTPKFKDLNFLRIYDNNWNAAPVCFSLTFRLF